MARTGVLLVDDAVGDDGHDERVQGDTVGAQRGDQAREGRHDRLPQDLLALQTVNRVGSATRHRGRRGLISGKGSRLAANCMHARSYVFVALDPNLDELLDNEFDHLRHATHMVGHVAHDLRRRIRIRLDRRQSMELLREPRSTNQNKQAGER